MSSVSLTFELHSLSFLNTLEKVVGLVEPTHRLFGRVRLTKLKYLTLGKPGYEITGARILFEGEDLLAMAPNERTAKSVFWLPVPGRNPRGRHHTLAPSATEFWPIAWAPTPIATALLASAVLSAPKATA